MTPRPSSRNYRVVAIYKAKFQRCGDGKGESRWRGASDRSVEGDEVVERVGCEMMR